MDKIDYFSDEMTEETLKEAADTFFGKRKKIDDELELFFEQAEKLKHKAGLVKEKVSRINYLLPDKSQSLFWKKLGLEDSDYASIKGEWNDDVLLPWALTRRGQYQKIVLSLYDDLKYLVKDYLHGRYLDHPEIKGRKIITPNLTNLMTWAENINKEIHEINRSNRPGDVLAFTRRMDVDESSKRESVGSGLEYSYDQELSFEPVDFSSLGLPEYPEVPADKKSLDTATETARSIYKEREDSVRSILDEIYNS